MLLSTAKAVNNDNYANEWEFGLRALHPQNQCLKCIIDLACSIQNRYPFILIPPPPVSSSTAMYMLVQTNSQVLFRVFHEIVKAVSFIQISP